MNVDFFEHDEQNLDYENQIHFETLAYNLAKDGYSVSNHVDIKKLTQYKKSITNFINEVSSKSHIFSKESFFDTKGRHKIYGVVKVADGNLNELAQKVLQNQKSNIELLDKNDQVRGLLFDVEI